MTLTVSGVADLARDYHSALDPQSAPERMALRALTRFWRQMTRDITRRVPGYFGEVATVVFDAATFTDGIDLTTVVPAGVIDFIDARFLYNQSDPSQFYTGVFVPYEQRDMPTVIPSYTLLNNVLYLLGNNDVGELASAYANFSGLVLSYTPVPPALTTGTSELTGYPDDAQDAFAALLAAFWLRRLVGNPRYEIERVEADYQDAVAKTERDAFLGRIYQITQRQSYYIRAVR